MNLISQPGVSFGKPGLLFSPVFPRASSTCQIKFWLILSGGSSDFYLDLYLGGKKEGRLLRSSGSPSRPVWTEIVVDLG